MCYHAADERIRLQEQRLWGIFPSLEVQKTFSGLRWPGLIQNLGQFGPKVPKDLVGRTAVMDAALSGTLDQAWEGTNMGKLLFALGKVFATARLLGRVQPGNLQCILNQRNFFLLLVIALSLILFTNPGRSSDNDFTLVLFPDTQCMVENYPAVWETMPQWIVKYKTIYNIQAVIGLGDVVNRCLQNEFTTAINGWDIIKKNEIPYIPVIGNHDYNNWPNRVTTLWDTNFGTRYFTGRSWYGGCYEGSTANYYVKLNIGTQRYLVLALETFPRPSVIPWAQSIIDANQNSQVILVTHGYLNNNGALTQQVDRHGPGRYRLPECYGGQLLWDNFVKRNPQIFLVVCGHQVCTPTSAYSSGINNAGGAVAQLFCNHQCDANGGSGYMMLLQFSPSLGKIDVSTYSAFLNSYDLSGAYTIPYRRPQALRPGRARSTSGAIWSG